MSTMDWALPELQPLLQLDQEACRQVLVYTETLPDGEASVHLHSLLGTGPQADEFVAAFLRKRNEQSKAPGSPSVVKQPRDSKVISGHPSDAHEKKQSPPPAYAAPSGHPPSSMPAQDTRRTSQLRPHTNAVIRAAHIRARDEQKMQNWLQNLQYQYNIFNSEIEPEHETEYYCSCPIHQYQRAKWARYSVQDMWSNAVMYPGEKSYNDSKFGGGPIFSRNPYMFTVISPYGQYRSAWGGQLSPRADYHAIFIEQTIAMNNNLNKEAQRKIDAREPKNDIWHDDDLDTVLSRMDLNGTPDGKVGARQEKRSSIAEKPGASRTEAAPSKFAKFKQSIGIKTTEQKAATKVGKQFTEDRKLRVEIESEEHGRWQDEVTRRIVSEYQAKVGMASKIAHLRMHQPIQYLHLLRAGYFEPIPVDWAGSDSNPLKFAIEAQAGWRGLTPAWRGYEDTAEERLYWVLNHREGSVGMRMKPDFISEMNMARARMASAQPPPPEYYSAADTCHIQHTSAGYSNQVIPKQFVAYDRPEVATDDTMILLDVSGSMDFDPMRPNYNRYLVTGYSRTTQPKNKDVAKAVIRRFSDAMANHDHQFRGYDLTTFSSSAHYVGTVNHRNLDQLWQNIRIGGGTRVMTGWQKVKDLHFQKHSASAIHHPVFGWQAGPETPMLRLLLLLDGEATDMDEFELDLLGLSWAHVTIFLIGAEGCPHHHRHANELQRISDVNHHVSFVDAQGNCPERFVTHELLKRHLGYEISMREFTEMEELPPYVE